MKLPMIVATQEVSGQFNQPEASLGLAAAPSRALAQTGEVLTQEGLTTSAVYTQAKQQLRAADARMEFYDAKDKREAAVEQRKVELAQSGVHPDAYVPELVKTMTETGSQIATGMRYPEAQQWFLQDSKHYFTTQIKEAQWDALKMKNGVVLQDFAANALTWANQAVYAKKSDGSPDYEARDAAKARYSAELTRLSSGIMPSIQPGQAAAMRADWNQGVRVNEIYRDGRDPVRRGQLLTDLRSGNDPLIRHPEEFANSLETRWYEDDRRRQAETEAATHKAAKDFFGNAYDLLRDSPDRLQTLRDLHANPLWATMDQPWRQHLDEIASNPKLGPSDPATLRDILLSWPVPPRKIQQAVAAGKLNEADGTKWLFAAISRDDEQRREARMDARQAASDRKAADRELRTDAHQRFGEYMTLGMGELQYTGPGAQVMKGEQQDAQAEFRKQMLTRAQGAGDPLKDFPRNETPEAVYYDVMPPLVEKVWGSVAGARKRIEADIKKGRFKTRAAFDAAFPTEPAAGTPQYQVYIEAGRRFMILDDLAAREQALGTRYDELKKRSPRPQ